MATRANRLPIITIIVILLICIIDPACCQTPEDEMIKLLGGSYWSEASSVEKTNDGGYIIVGTNNSDGIGSENLWIVKTDSSGITNWEKSLGVPKSIGRSILRTNDDRYFITAITESKNNTDLNAWIIKTNTAGGIDKNETVIGGKGRDQVYSILQTADNNYTLVGSTESSIEDKDNDIWLIRLFNNGSLNWTRSINLNGDDIGRSATQTKERGYLIAGYTIPPTSKKSEILLIATDSEGRITENKNIAKLSSDLTKLGLNKVYSIIKTKDEYVILGSNESLASDKKKCSLVKFFENGTEIWNCSFDDMGYNAARSVIETKDGEYVIVGETNSNDHGSLDAWIAKINSTGSKVWSRAIGGTGYDIGNSVLQADDGGFVIVGATGSYGNRTLKGWLLKVNSTGHEEWNTTLGLPSLLATKETRPERWNATAVNLDTRYTNPFLNVFSLVLIKPLLFLFGVWILYRILKSFKSIYFKRELVIEDFVNASADDSLKDVLVGLREDMTENVIKNIDSINKTLEDHKNDLGPTGCESRPEFIFSPKEARIESVKDMADSLKELAPANVKPLIALISALLPKHQGIKISCSLQGHKDQSDILGMTVRLTENRDSGMTVVKTFWEPKSKTSEPKKNFDKIDRIKSLKIIAHNLSNVGIYADSVKYLKEAFDLDPSPSLKGKLSTCYDKQKEIEMRRLYYNKARNFQNEGEILKAKENYDLSLKNHHSPNLYFCNKKIHYLIIADLYSDIKMIDEAIELFKLAKEKQFKGEKELDNLKKLKARHLLDASKELLQLLRESEASIYLEAALELSPQDLEIKNHLEKAKAAIQKQKKPYTRFKDLMDRASIWSAIEVSKWSMLDNMPLKYKLLNATHKLLDALPIPFKHKLLDIVTTISSTLCHNGILCPKGVASYRSEVYLFCGILKLSNAVLKGYSEFYQLAKTDFYKARDLCTSWYRPYSYLGDTYSFEAKNSNEKRELARKAILNYKEARIKIDKKNPIENIPNQRKSADYININLAIAQFLAGDARMMKNMLKETNLRSYLSAKNESACLGSDLKGQHSARTLYNYACLIGLAKASLKENQYQSLEEVVKCCDIIKYAKALIIYSMARDRYGDVLYIVDKDPDLKEIMDLEEINKLKFEVQLKRVTTERLYEQELDKLKKELSQILPNLDLNTARSAPGSA